LNGFPRCIGTIKREQERVFGEGCSFSSPGSFRYSSGECSSSGNRESCLHERDMTQAGLKKSSVKEPLIGRERLAEAYFKARSCLVAQQSRGAFWVGELASSSLSTATAICALSLVDRRRFAGLIAGGSRWLLDHQNSDGGWGDTVKSFSNISTTMLCRAALTF